MYPLHKHIHFTLFLLCSCLGIFLFIGPNSPVRRRCGLFLHHGCSASGVTHNVDRSTPGSLRGSVVCVLGSIYRIITTRGQTNNAYYFLHVVLMHWSHAARKPGRSRDITIIIDFSIQFNLALFSLTPCAGTPTNSTGAGAHSRPKKTQKSLINYLKEMTF